MAELLAAQVKDVSAIVAIDPDSLGSPGQIQALVREQASLVAVERGEIAGFLALKPGHFYQLDSSICSLSHPAGGGRESAALSCGRLSGTPRHRGCSCPRTSPTRG